MRRKTKIVSVFLAAVLCMALFAGCGGNASTVDVKNAKSLADLKGAKIAAQAGTFHADALAQIEDVQSSTLPEFPTF